jgi:hypothetical protein
MQHIRDNEFDQLFKDKFEGAEVTPPVNLWSAIETQLEVKPKRVFPVYWFAAAVSMAAVAIGLLFYQTGRNQQQRVVVASSGKKEILRTAESPVISKSPVNAVSLPVSLKMKNPGSGKISPDSTAARFAAGGEKVPATVTAAKKDLAALQPLTLNTHLYIKEIRVKQEKRTLPEPVPPAVDDIVLASAAETPNGRDMVINENENRTAHTGIRNMGDLINYVVDKVDKREEKVIQFQTEDDNSSIIAINIGMFKFNQKKHK